MNFVNIFLKRLEETSTFERGDILFHGQVTAEWFGYNLNDIEWMCLKQVFFFLRGLFISYIIYILCLT